MINKVKVVNSYGDELVMTLTKPQLSGYAITNISGLGPMDTDIKQVQMVSGRKYKYVAGFHKQRDIGFTIVYYDWNDLYLTVEELRNRLYSFFKNNDKVKLYFEKDTTIYAIEGWVSKHEPMIFGTTSCGVSINVTCPDPWFRKNDIDYVDKVYSTYNNAHVIYEGNISTGFKVITENDVRNYCGKQLSLRSYFEKANIERYFLVNVPNKYNDQHISIDSLYIDLMSDTISVYTKHNDSHGLVPQLVYARDAANDYNHDFFYSFDSKIALKMCGENYYGDFGTEVDGLRYHPVRYVTDQNIYCDGPEGFKNFINNYFTKVKIAANSGIETAEDIITRPIRAGGGQEDNLFALFGDKEIIPSHSGLLGFKILQFDKDNSYRSSPYMQPTYYNGWIDATSISKRQELPEIFPGDNVISLDVNPGSTPLDYIIEYNTLYRGL